MLKAKKESNYTKGIVPVLITIFLLITGYALYKPLPEGFTISKWDRAVMHVVEPALRVAYYYPSRMFTKPSNMVQWTRGALNTLSKTLGLLVNTHGQVDIKWHKWNETPVKVYRPTNNKTSTDGAVLFIHGGGFALGNVDMYDSLVKRMAYEMKTLFISIEYRLSPETVFPGGILDCEAAIDHFFDFGAVQFGVNTSKVVIMGDSAGGNLATVIAQRRAARNSFPKLAGQVLIYPLLQMADMQTVSYRYFHSRLRGYALVDPESVAYYYMFYAGIDMDEKAYLVPSVISNGHVANHLQSEASEIMSYKSVIEMKHNYKNHSITERWEVSQSYEAQDLMEPFLTNPDFSPLMRKDLSNLPPTMVITCEFDILRDEGLIYGERLKVSGVPTTTIHYENGFHAMLNFHSELDEASKSVDDIEQWTLNAINNA
ncbi:Alpha/beta hydrolase fold-3 domain-containing protein [Caenorhabditis elegans]|uniref:Alpha/beta hydrolase fold-3 domain-containing protein n=1 Tax=Caenorhabditis elegans TaxID=6239 RepID=Q19839_CAEEL|nr:Alpha/beta hydrolase fold-3 domain-containing protein [Caenorhabditis elegans]CAA92464.1 Alpha/beta hydrolase fold-3 domain-containing protein [Caenorhabditis elegans]|eukprot:NP_501702.1 TRansport of membrane to Cell Surface [Caenorhabditis elegans]